MAAHDKAGGMSAVRGLPVPESERYVTRAGTRKPPIKPGDHVRVNDGLPFLAEVAEVDGRFLVVRPIIEGRRHLAPRHVKRSWVDAHWSRV